MSQTGGGISLNAVTPNVGYQSFNLYGWDILSRAGDITIQTNGLANWNTTDTRNLGAKAGSDVTSSSANINVITTGMYDTTGNSSSRISTSGDVAFKPYGSVFSIDYTTQFDIQAGSFDFGKIANVNSATSNATFNYDVTAQRGITISALSMTVYSNADLTTMQTS